jgi:type VI secretion system protein ImpB
MTKVDRSEELEGLLEDVLQDQDKLNSLAQDLGSTGGEG